MASTSLARAALSSLKMGEQKKKLKHVFVCNTQIMKS